MTQFALTPYPFTLPVFQKKSGIDFNLTSFRSLMAGCLLSISLILIDKLVISFLDKNDLSTLAFLMVAIMLISFIWGRREKEVKHGYFDGHITFHEDHFQQDGKTFYWSKLKISKLNSSHVLNDDIYNNTHHIGPRYSLGVDSFLEFEFEGKSQRIFFQFENYENKRNFDKMIKDQFRKGNIPLMTTYDGLHLEYEEIQELKKLRNK